MLIAVLCAVALGHLAQGQEPLVTTSQGTMKGKVLKSRDGRDFFSFTKIPFAKPPLGKRRFMISEKADNWTGILDATQKIPACYQPGSMVISEPGEEDCLYLNVFTPNLTGKLPVIFSIYGGAFIQGAAYIFNSSSYFMDEDVVVVAPNYRLGALGFLSLEDNVIPGNMGLKDQALALEWVHKEISAFGGDPNRITVIGQSAGGASSDFICSAPRTNGLINSCVLQSGTAWAPWAIEKPGISRQMALKLANAVGCGGVESGVILKCLQQKPVEIVANISLIDNFPSLFGFTMLSPVLEPVNAPGALLTSWPTSANHNYPMIVGICQDEGLFMTAAYENHMVDQEAINKYINSFNETLITTLNLQNRTDDFERLRKRFFTKEIEPLKAIRNYYTELLFGYSALKSLSKHPGPTYYYRFNYTRGPMTAIYKESGGVSHNAEMFYFFDIVSTPDWPKPEDVALSKQLVKMWVNFARDQTPGSQDTFQWPQFQGQYYLDIQDTGVKISNYMQYQETLDFWKSYISDEYNPDSSKSSTIQSSLIFIAVICISTFLKTIVVSEYGDS